MNESGNDSDTSLHSIHSSGSQQAVNQKKSKKKSSGLADMVQNARSFLTVNNAILLKLKYDKSNRSEIRDLKQ